MEIELSVTDLKNRQLALERIARHLEIGDLLARVGLLIERQAKINATGRPGPRVQTDRLRSSITVHLSPTEPVEEALVGTNVQYAPYVEFGHEIVAQFKGMYGSRQFFHVGKRAPAYPFLGPALTEVQASGEMDGVFASFGQDIERDWLA